MPVRVGVVLFIRASFTFPLFADQSEIPFWRFNRKLSAPRRTFHAYYAVVKLLLGQLLLINKFLELE